MLLLWVVVSTDAASVVKSNITNQMTNALETRAAILNEYIFLNVENGVYLYHEDDALLNTKTANAGYQEILRRVQADGGAESTNHAGFALNKNQIKYTEGRRTFSPPPLFPG